MCAGSERANESNEELIDVDWLQEDGEREPLVRIWVAGSFRRIPRAWWEQLEGPRPPFNFGNDGCTYSPDWLPASGYAVWPACVIHDWHYAHGRALQISRWKADWVLAKNIYRLMRIQGAGRLHSASIAAAYWQGVRRLGAAHYEDG